jgi:hypothetical protein
MTRAALLRTLDASLSEREWQRQVVSLAKSLGWEIWHPQISVWSKGGWPDLVLLKPPRALFWELKTERGTEKPAQKHMLRLLEMCGLTVAVVRPHDREWVHRQLMGED